MCNDTKAWIDSQDARYQLITLLWNSRPLNSLKPKREFKAFCSFKLEGEMVWSLIFFFEIFILLDILKQKVIYMEKEYLQNPGHEEKEKI